MKLKLTINATAAQATKKCKVLHDDGVIYLEKGDYLVNTQFGIGKSLIWKSLR